MMHLVRSCYPFVALSILTFPTGCSSPGGSPIVPDAAADVNVPDAPAKVEGGAPDAGPDTGEDTKVDLHGSERQLYLTGEEDVASSPVDLSAAVVSVDSLDPSSGAFQHVNGVGKADGTFVVSGVPLGTFYLRRGEIFVVTDQTEEIDLSDYSFGKGDRPVAASATSFRTNVSVASPGFVEGDTLELYAPRTGAAYFGLETFGPNVATGTDVDITFDLADPDVGGQPLISSGDPGFLIHLRKLQTGGREYHALTNSLTTVTLAQEDGQASTLSGSLSSVTDSPSVFTLNWDRAAWASPSVLGKVGPQGRVTLVAQWFWINAIPNGTGHGFPQNVPAADLLTFYPELGADRIDNVTFSYANPFPASYGVFTYVVSQYIVSYQLPGTTTAMFRPGAIETLDTREAAMAKADAQHAFPPSVGPVETPTIDGHNFFADTDNISTEPTLTWNAPTTGTATGYIVEVSRLHPKESNPTLTDRTRVARFHMKGNATGSTSLRIPPGMLEKDQPYYFTVWAKNRPNTPLEHTPLLASFPDASAVTFSGIVRTAP